MPEAVDSHPLPHNFWRHWFAMADAWAEERDAAALHHLRYLAAPRWREFRDRAVVLELREQILHPQTLPALPEAEAWPQIAAALSPAEQADWLVARLPHMACQQLMDPGWIDFASDYSCFMSKPKRLNPYATLLAMDPDPGTLGSLENLLFDSHFVHAWHAVRTFAPPRTWYRVSNVAATLLYELDPTSSFPGDGWNGSADEQAELRLQFRTWITENSGTTLRQRLQRTVGMNQHWPTFVYAIKSLEPTPELFQAVAERVNAPPPGRGARTELAAWLYVHAKPAPPEVEKWAAGEDPFARAWAVAFQLRDHQIEDDIASQLLLQLSGKSNWGGYAPLLRCEWVVQYPTSASLVPGLLTQEADTLCRAIGGDEAAATLVRTWAASPQPPIDFRNWIPIELWKEINPSWVSLQMDRAVQGLPTPFRYPAQPNLAVWVDDTVRW